MLDLKHLYKAFTLIELLVVISIIALLIAILFPALTSSRGAAKSSLCLSSQRQLGVMFYGYASDYDNLLPAVVTNDYPGTDGHWFLALARWQYASGDELNRVRNVNPESSDFRAGPNVFWGCPEWSLEIAGSSARPDYAMNRWVNYDNEGTYTGAYPYGLHDGIEFGTGTFVPYSFDTVTKQSDRALIVDGKDYQAHIDPLVNPLIAQQVFGWEITDQRRHNKVSDNVLFFDGHASSEQEDGVRQAFIPS
ncbi:MAG: prepilin-type N-terminal cleavage/methylation domain-containing protein [Planctomycetota bacterium]